MDITEIRLQQFLAREAAREAKQRRMQVVMSTADVLVAAGLSPEDAHKAAVALWEAGSR